MLSGNMNAAAASSQRRPSIGEDKWQPRAIIAREKNKQIKLDIYQQCEFRLPNSTWLLCRGREEGGQIFYETNFFETQSDTLTRPNFV